MEKTFIIFGLGNDGALRTMANGAVENLYKKRGHTAIPFNHSIHDKPDAILYCTRSLFSIRGEVVYYITTMSGKAVCSFVSISAR